ncbi:Tetratricopeptide repeat-containing protein [Chryseolinea serpens]|uniref:Tetratricopeptide repeat-containing protein n=1 Tax=Chryseolinea serpens TaxID=947013 RepID=A0A1M5X049_9BACT|nr:tetratricopeptide repeat protein [Chryseolinea serpens]SHH93286.1 Tetratricopeptide repeat-containing protein [Chryseolinea serpens]
MNDGTSPGPQPTKARLYFLLGCTGLFFMALLWSVDRSVVAILLGFAAICFLLAFNSRPASTPRRQGPVFQKQRDYTPATFLSVLFGRLLKGQQTNYPPPNPRRRSAAVVIIFVVFVFTIILVVTLSSLFSDDGSLEAYGYFQTADNHYYNQQYDSARMNYRRAWQVNPKYAEAYLGYGRTLFLQSQPDSAIILFDQALAIDPGLKEASYGKAEVFADQKKYDEAIAILKQLAADYPDYEDARQALADCYYSQQKFDAALPLYESVYANESSRSHILCYIMAYIYDSKGNTQKAIPLYQEALQYDSTVVDIYDRLGELMPGEAGNVYRTKAVTLKR